MSARKAIEDLMDKRIAFERRESCLGFSLAPGEDVPRIVK